jgi:hypothetical protein
MQKEFADTIMRDWCTLCRQRESQNTEKVHLKLSDNTMNDDEFRKLINESESEYLDFKEKTHESNLELVHDIICLANANSQSDRYIVYGINDNKSVVGVSNDEVKKFNTNHLESILRNANLNKSLFTHVKLTPYEIDEKRILILKIKNIPQKPFFLLKNYEEKTKKNKSCIKSLKAGAIYTRNVSENTPINSTALDDEVELMWRERFGIDKTPYDRSFIFLKDYDNWRSDGENGYIYYGKSPEYKIIEIEQDSGNVTPEQIKEDFSEYILPVELYWNVRRCVYRLQFNGTNLGIDCTVLVGLDNYRRIIPYPYGHQNYKKFEPFIQDDYGIDMCQIIQRCYWWESGIVSYDVMHTIKHWTRFKVKQEWDST